LASLYSPEPGGVYRGMRLADDIRFGATPYTPRPAQAGHPSREGTFPGCIIRRYTFRSMVPSHHAPDCCCRERHAPAVQYRTEPIPLLRGARFGEFILAVTGGVYRGMRLADDCRSGATPYTPRPAQAGNPSREGTYRSPYYYGYTPRNNVAWATLFLDIIASHVDYFKRVPAIVFE
jgi:hypothetical protein